MTSLGTVRQYLAETPSMQKLSVVQASEPMMSDLRPFFSEKRIRYYVHY
jgi:hypothetical protein